MSSEEKTENGVEMKDRIDRIKLEVEVESLVDHGTHKEKGKDKKDNSKTAAQHNRCLSIPPSLSFPTSVSSQDPDRRCVSTRTALCL